MAGKVFNSKLGGETNLISESSFYLGGAMFQRGRYWGLLLPVVTKNVLPFKDHKSSIVSPNMEFSFRPLRSTSNSYRQLMPTLH